MTEGSKARQRVCDYYNLFDRIIILGRDDMISQQFHMCFGELMGLILLSETDANRVVASLLPRPPLLFKIKPTGEAEIIPPIDTNKKGWYQTAWCLLRQDK